MRKKMLVTLALVYIMCCCGQAWATVGPGGIWQQKKSAAGYSEHQEGLHYLLRDEKGQLVTEVSRPVYSGDELILPDGKHYRVSRVVDKTVTVKLLGENKKYLGWLEFFKNKPVQATAANDWRERPVGIYHSHTGESYVPSSGEALVPFEGDIYRVGEKFEKALTAKNIDVIYYQTPHDPHDNNAYVRSRRTASGILRGNPVAIFDLHRDGVPDPTDYRTEIDGEQVAKIRIVVGRQNGNRKVNQDFAKRLMAHAEQLYPGIMKDIYIGRGNYNQDLLSTSLLLEVGTYTNSLEEAERGIMLFTDTVPVVLGLTEEDVKAAAGTVDEMGAGGWRKALALIFTTVLVAGVFMLINAGSYEKALERVVQSLRGAVNQINSRIRNIKNDNE
ncbi:stage II sporulation protein P [Desulfofalx alkaliphila]|uniref:stage II sporulation protein P n=1 Tax=Desulfofalx alkaliphila TaxID=105483 RepID=UPI00068B2C38|nr:stage II sporulation protein P [Desulfofalx alkaliphila]